MHDGDYNHDSTPKLPLGKIIGGALGAIVLIFGVIWISSYFSNKGTAHAKESSLSTSYNNGAQLLSTCINNTNGAAQVAAANAQALDKTLLDVMSRQGGATNVDLSGSNASGLNALRPLLVQAYPNLAGQTDLFNKVVSIMVGCQNDYSAAQTRVQDVVRDFNTWRGGAWVSFTGGGSYPDDQLYVAVPGTPRITGEEALERMEQPIVNSVAAGAYNSGTYNPSPLFPTPSAPTTK